MDSTRAIFELDLLRHIYGSNQRLPPHVTLGPGDDMGALRVPFDRGSSKTSEAAGEVLVTVDQLADTVHFDVRSMPLEKVARKALTRNLSDVAAMAAVPTGAVVAACLPRDFGAERATQLFDAMRRTAEQFACPIFGGDICVWDHPLLLTVTVLAEPQGIEPVRREGAQVGDAIYVTGDVGGTGQTMPDGTLHHLDFEPRINVARTLARQHRPHCMIDLSDGLAKDLGHLCNAAGLAALVFEEHLPTGAAAQQAAQRSGRPLWHHAVGDGEDYELCFTTDAHEKLPPEIEGVKVTRIGEMVERQADAPLIWIVLRDGRREAVELLGWEHHG